MPRPSFNPVEFFQLKPRDRYAARIYRLWESLDYNETPEEYLEKADRLRIVLRPCYIDYVPDPQYPKPATEHFERWYAAFLEAIKTIDNPIAIGKALEEQLTDIIHEAGLIGGEDKEVDLVVTEDEVSPGTEIEPTEDVI
jgi:hypothetical protein